MNPMLSIITVCYNSAPLLEDTIESILSQKTSSVEYIIVDGASTDETPKVLKQHRDHIDLIIREPDDGIFDAMNKGISNAKGKYLLFVNAGDTLCDGSLKYIGSQVTTDLDVYYFGYYNLVTVRGEKLIFEGPKSLNLSHEIPTCHNAMAISKKTFDSYGLYDTSYRLCADYEWLCRNNAKLKTKHCDKKLLYYLLGGVSEIDELTVLIEKALISKKYFGWAPFAWHIIRFMKVAPISLLKRLLIKIGVFDYYLSIKYMLKGAKNVPSGDPCSK